MKKLICLALCLLLVCTVSIARAEDESSACSHSYGEGIVTAGPTCGQAGVRTYTCTLCRNTKTESLPAAGEHSWNGGYRLCVFEQAYHERRCHGDNTGTQKTPGISRSRGCWERFLL